MKRPRPDFDNSVSYRLVVRFKTKQQMKAWERFFQKYPTVLHVECRTRKDNKNV